MQSARPPILYKYLDPKGAAGLLWHRQFWYRCPLHPKINDHEDSQADLLEHFDVGEFRRVHRDELVRLLCEPSTCPPPVSMVGCIWRGYSLRKPPWTPPEVDKAFGAYIASLFGDKEEHRLRVRDGVRSVLADLRILCLSEDPSSEYMWDRYAAGATGACIGFHYVPELDNALGAARRVVYVDDWPSIASPLEWARHILGLELIPFDKRAGDGLLVKRKKWQVEREWRIINRPKAGSTADEDGVLRITIDPPEVAEIIFGTRMEAAHREALSQLAKEVYPTARLHRASIPE